MTDLTVPIGRKPKGERICDIKLPLEQQWRSVHWKMLVNNYVRTDFFAYHKDFFEKLYLKNFEFLWQINEEIIFYLLDCFEIKVEVIKASEINVDANLGKTDLMIALLKSAAADVYLSGPSGRNYLETEKFPNNNINLKFFKFEHPVYKQRHPGFEPNMSAIDLLFNMGPQACKIIKASGRIED